jgi:hypothetical protein
MAFSFAKQDTEGGQPSNSMWYIKRGHARSAQEQGENATNSSGGARGGVMDISSGCAARSKESYLWVLLPLSPASKLKLSEICTLDDKGEKVKAIRPSCTFPQFGVGYQCKFISSQVSIVYS